MKRIFISISVLVLISVGGFGLYNAAYSKGETTGYDKGYPVGHETGYSSGKEAGYETGYVSGKQDGYDEGYISGEQDGYSEGHSEGYESGETDGYSSGRQIGYEVGYDEGIEAGLGHDYTIKDPTYQEAITFLNQDKTDRNRYNEDIYVCSHFARDVCNNAEDEGIRCAFVELRYPEMGHTIIAFNTIDKGLIYFEPQTDEGAKPEVGKRYYQCVEPRPGYRYVRPSYDDTIQDILVIW